MASTYSPSLRLELMATGDQSGTWGDTTNTNLGTLLEQAITGYLSKAMADTNQTLTNLNGASDEARNMVVEATGALTAGRNIVVPTAEKLYLIKNSTTGGFAVTVKTSAGTGVAVPMNGSRWVYCDGTNVVDGQSGPLTPTTSDSAALGTAALMWSDLFLASGGVVNFDNGNMVLTHSTGVLTASTGDIRVTTAGTNTASVVTVGGTQTLTNKGLQTPTLILKQGTNPLPTAEGDIQWDTDDNAIQVGDGSGTKIFYPNAWEFITTASPSAATTQPFTDLSAYRILRLTFYLTPSVDNEIIYLQVSTNNGAGYDSSNYAGQRLESFSTTTASNTTTNVGFQLARGVGNTTPEAASGTIVINEFNQAKQAFGLCTSYFLDGSAVSQLGTYGGRSTITTARNAIRILPGSGNITGRIVLEGVRG